MEFIRKSFSRRLSFAYTVLFILIFLTAGFLAARRLDRQSTEHLKESLALDAELIARIVLPAVINWNEAEIQGLSIKMGELARARITVVDPSGKVLGDSSKSLNDLSQMEDHKNRPEIRAALSGQTSAILRYSDTLEQKMLYVAVPLKENDRILGALRASVSLERVKQIIQSVERPLLWSLIFGIILTILAGIYLGRSVRRNLLPIVTAASRYARGDLEKKIYVKEKDELAMLAESLNRMAFGLKARMKELENERNKASGILTNLRDGVVAVDAAKQILLMNRSALKLFALPSAPSGRRSLIETVKIRELDDFIEGALRERRIVKGEVSLSYPEKKILHVHAAPIEISDADGGVAGILVLTDVTELRKLEKVRQDFVANVSHELRTPLTSIKGFIETLLSGAMQNEARASEFLKMMEEDAARLNRLIDDLLELSKIESAQVPMRFQSVNLPEIVDGIFNLIRPMGQEKKLSFENKISKSVATAVYADPDRLRQVLLNLIDNAVKFNRDGGRVTVRAVQQGNQVTVSIEDTGVGIPQESIPRIFERFYRVDKARSRSLGGTGLGLAIVKHIVEAHGGTVSCQSESGRGSVFSFTLSAAS